MSLFIPDNLLAQHSASELFKIASLLLPLLDPWSSLHPDTLIRPWSPSQTLDLVL